MEHLIGEIEAYLIIFGNQGLCDGDRVRDALLDLLLLAKGLTNATPNSVLDIPVRTLEEV